MSELNASAAAPEPTDAELMGRLGAGEVEALAPLIKRHQQRVLATAYRFTGRRDAAEDLAQDVFVRVFRSAALYSPQAAFSTWLYRLVVNLCLDRRRRAVREANSLAVLRLRQPRATEDHEAADERAAQVRAAVGRLPDRQRLALILHRFDGMSHQEIAAATGWSVGAVESCLVRAYESLRKSLSSLEPGA
jgi:RNA polymerase sigma-70 factor (ECF subfamily)